MTDLICTEKENLFRDMSAYLSYSNIMRKMGNEMELNETKRNKTEQNGTERNGVERNESDQIGASCIVGYGSE